MSTNHQPGETSQKDSIALVVVSIIGGDALRQFLARCPSDIDERIVVARSAADAASLQIRGWMPVDGSGVSVPGRRLLGLEKATSEIVAFVEDTSVPGESWAFAVRKLFADPRVAVAGGPVGIDERLPAASMALACSEYGRFFPSARMHAVPENDPVNASRVAGNNFALRRSSLHADEFSGEGIIEHEMIARIAATEQVARLDPEMIVTYAFPDPAGARLITRFRHGRLYAGRAVRLGGESRLIGFAKTPLLPFVLSFRAMMAMASEVSLLKHWRVIPAVIFQQIAWSIGESAGYLGGEGKIEESWV